MTKGQEKLFNDVSTSSASTSSQKRKERNKRYYKSHKVSKVHIDDVSQSNSLFSLINNESIERIPLRNLQTNGSQITQTPTGDSTSTTRHAPVHWTNDVCTSNSSTSAEKRKGRNKRYYASRKENTPTTTLFFVTNEVLLERSRGIRIRPRTLLPQLCDIINQPSNYDALSEDHRLHCQSTERVRNMVLKDISVFLQSMGKNIDDFDLSKITRDANLQYAIHHDVQEEYRIFVEPEHLSAKDSLNHDRKVVYDEIMTHVDNDLLGVFFIDGPGGTGKTFLYKALPAEVRSRGLIALATASLGASANNMQGGRTAYSRFKIPINLNNNLMCTIRKQSGAAEVIRSAKIIIWDEASIVKRHAIEAVDRTLQDIIGVTLTFGGNIMVMGGDFIQVLSVIKRGTRAQIVDSSLRMSPLWSLTTKMRLTINMRALSDPWYSNFLLRVGDGSEESIEGDFIRIPDDMTIQCDNRENSVKQLIKAVFPSIEVNAYSSNYIISRAILSTKNDSVGEINDQMIDLFHGEEKVYYSFDEAEDDHHNFYPTELLNSLTVSGLPPHKLRLKIGCPIILLRNIDPSHGLFNSTRLICKAFQRNVIDVEIAVGQHAGERVFLPRIPLRLSKDDMFPFKLKRKQFPIRLSFSMTINKAQVQTIPHVGVYLLDSVFSHGQLYVALSRGISRQNTKVLVHPAKDLKRLGVYTSKVVYQEVLRHE